MTIAFYAPMKPPGHPVPSGDREMARALIAALGYKGRFKVDLTSEFQCRDGKGDPEQQQGLIAKAETEVAALLAHPSARDWRAWMTYHNYYKAPDLLGPAVSQALGIPYLLVEATRASKRLSGPWAEFAARAEAATDAATAVLYMTAHDGFALKRDAPADQNLVNLKPFLPRTDLPEAAARAARPPVLLAVGMMRAGDKLASYELIAQSLRQVADLPWHLSIAGDGPTRDAVVALMEPFRERVTFLGQRSEGELDRDYSAANAFLWPGVNEAFGMTYLEAQSYGLPVIAQDRPGVRDVLAPGAYPSPKDGTEGIARRIASLLTDSKTAVREASAAREYVARHHLLPAAADTLVATLEKVGVTP